MPRSTQNKLYNTFVGGLITEASELTYPENASVDEDNCVLFRQGNRTRRLGFEYETGFQYSSFTSQQAEVLYPFKEFTWFSVNNKAGTNFLCQQVGPNVFFWDLVGEAATGSEKSFSIDLSEFNAPAHPDVSDADVEFASGRGYLFIVGEKIQPLIVEYLEDSDTIKVTALDILIRDFEGIDDNLANDQEPTTLSPEHEYNLKNQGWIDPQNSGQSGVVVGIKNDWNTEVTYFTPTSNVINDYFNETGFYPGNNKQWWVAKLGADDDTRGLKEGDFDPKALSKEYLGNTHAPKGHFILSAFFKDRATASGVAATSSFVDWTYTGTPTGDFSVGSFMQGLTSGALGTINRHDPVAKTIRLSSVFGTFITGGETLRETNTGFEATGASYSFFYADGGLAPEVTDGRPEGVAFYAGRTWYCQGSDVYFSQVLTNRRKASFCYQDADPTSEHISDLIDTDGGQIPIPEARRIKRLVPHGGGVLAFAENGVWSVTGTSAGFTASDYSVSKVSNSGLDAPNSIVQAGGRIYWWSQTGIQGLQQSSGVFGPVAGSFEQETVTQQTIQSYYNSTIPSSSRPYVKGIYDKAANLVQWLWSSGAPNSRWAYDRILNLDLTLNAFYPWSISKNPSAEGPYIVGAFETPLTNEITGAELVTVLGETVTADGENVTSSTPNITVRNRSNKFIAAVPQGTEYAFTAGLFSNTSCADWERQSGSIGFAYESYLRTGFELFQDTMRNKQLPYVFIYFKRSEQNFIEGNSGDYTVDFPSSCKFRTKWDWADTRGSNKWSAEIEAYRHRQVPNVDVDALSFDTGFPVIYTKNRVRGHGKAIQFEFRNNEIGSNFDLLGWAVHATGSTQP